MIDAVRPAMATVPGAMLLCASTPYARRGVIWNAHRRHHGHEGDPVLVWQAPTRAMNPTVPQRVIDEAVERDPAWASAEYLAEFRSDLEAFVDRAVIEALIDLGVRERPPVPVVHYSAFCDPAGGSGGDSFTLAVGHREGDIITIDAIRERKPPFSPSAVVAEFSALFKAYSIGSVHGDKYAGSWPSEAFSKHGITYQPAPMAKSDLYVNALAALNSGRVALVDHPKLVNQVVGLERRSGRGKDIIDHAPGAHDDVCNSALGLVALMAAKKLERWGPEAVIMGRPLAAAAHADFMKYGATGPRPASLFDQYDPRTAEGRANLADYQRTPWRW